MNRWSPVAFAAVLLFCGPSLVNAQITWPPNKSETHKFEPGVTAPPGANSAVLGSVVRGNTTLEFQAANSADIASARLRTWSEFAAGHPEIAQALAYHPSLMNDAAYMRKHPALDEFFDQHPDIQAAMMENPGNFVAIPPRPGE